MNTTTVCPHCGQLSSDHEFCDNCNREIAAGPVIEPPPSSVQLRDGCAIDCSRWSGTWPQSPESFLEVTHEERQYRVHGISPALWPNYQKPAEERERIRLAALPPITVVPVARGAVVISESAGRAAGSENANRPKTARSRVDFVLQRCRQLQTAMQELHGHGYVWLNFNPDAIEATSQGIRITNLDLALFSIGQCPERLAVSRFSPPEVCLFQANKIGPSTDVFHLAFFAYLVLAEMGGFPGRGLEAFRFEFPPVRIYWPEIPVGIWPVLQKALKPEASERYPTLDAFIDELEIAAADSRKRAEIPSTTERRPHRASLWEILRRSFASLRPFNGKLRNTASTTFLDIGQRTIAGIAKDNVPNQDTLDVFQRSHCGRNLTVAIVSDGVSTARLGTGDRASRIACETIHEVIQRELDAQQLPLSWKDLLSKACLAASDAIVADAASLPNRAKEICDSDVMSTTAIVGVVDGDVLHVANVGDSRAYLVRGRIAEQLTVDGDVACSLLREFKPPEEVQELGVQAKALRYCLGACECHDGALVCDHVRSAPQFASWRILPGEFIVICSDGLVEEGVFLEAEDLCRIISAGEGTSAQDIAESLVNEANRRQRPHTEAEPSGFGDNISCVVIRFATMPPLPGSPPHG